MTSPSMRFILRSPGEEHYDGPADCITASTDTGELQILPGHAPLVGNILASALMVASGSHETSFFVRQGFLIVTEGGMEVTLMALSCHKTGELTRESLHEYLAFLHGKLERQESLSAFQVRYLKSQLSSVEQMIEVVSEHNGGPSAL